MKIIVVLVMICSAFSMKAQELNCQVSIIIDVNEEVTTTDQERIKQLEQIIFDFMNTTKWTKDEFTVEERINCNLQLQITDIPSSDNFSGSLQVQSSRPAFNSSYNTTLLNFQDEDIAFGFSRNSVLQYAPNQFKDNLTSILAFYAYYIIGLDYDSFSLKGGSMYFSKAQEIVILAQTAGGKGWRSNETGKKNRYWLIDNALHELFSPLRECVYEYHRKGVDLLYDDIAGGRKAIYTAMNKLVKVVATRPNSLNLRNFVQAKTNELKSLYEDAEQKEKQEIVNLLKRLDPGNSSKYQEILG